MKYEITLEQLQFLAQYAKCGMATNGRDLKELRAVCSKIEAAEIEPTGRVFRPIEEWHEDMNNALFFNVRVQEPPEVTSPLATCFDAEYHTHFMELPKEFKLTKDFNAACIQSGVDIASFK
ncbi:hypothetical protein G6Z94_11710 [Vibrio aestuarianus]|uniref:hypothetical protein n=1 Tax=Vibrio aestuarianus TaxID=28171 RepID=UPI0015946C90|nr:hypothetical protein [Vibrio aestuarianus]NGZ18005.1 hypothetical protein [Vibrio aestuarianus]